MQTGDRYLPYVTRQGERWDEIALRVYGDTFRFAPLVAANPEVPITATLNAGLILQVPLLSDDAEELTPDPALLPPWKRPAALEAAGG